MREVSLHIFIKREIWEQRVPMLRIEQGKGGNMVEKQVMSVAKYPEEKQKR